MTSPEVFTMIATPLGELAIAAFVLWFTGRQDRAAKRGQ